MVKVVNEYTTVEIMKTVKQGVFNIRYKESGTEFTQLVEANDFIEALGVFNNYYKDHSNIKLLEITRWTPIIKPLSKTITVEL